MLIQGHSQREIARTLHTSGHSVAKVDRRADFPDFIREQQESLFAIAPDALESLHASVKKDGHLAYTFLKDLGIIPSREDLVTLMDPTPQEFATGQGRIAFLVANILLEGNKNFGTRLPDNVAEALAKDAECQESKASGAKPPRD